MLRALLAWLLVSMPAGPVPTAVDRSISLLNYRFVGLPSDSDSAGRTNELWTIRNKGPALHEFVVLRLRDSTELPAIDDWITRGASRLLPPAPVVVSVEALIPGEAVTRRVRLEPGLYVVLCMVPAGRNANGEIRDHTHLGMRSTFVIGAD